MADGDYSNGLTHVQGFPLTPNAYAIANGAFFGAGAAAVYELNVNPASYVVTFASVQLLVDRQLNVNAASYSLTFPNVDLVYTPAATVYELNINPASYALTFPSVQLLVDRQLNVNPGSYSLTFPDFDLAYTPSAGAYELNVNPASYQLSFSGIGLEYESSQQPAGRPSKKRRWAIEHNGEIVPFSTAQAAIAYISRQNKKAKAAPVNSAIPEIPAKTETIPLSAITFDGVKVSALMVDGKRAIDRIKTMRDAEIAVVERKIREMQDDDDIIMLAFSLVA